MDEEIQILIKAVDDVSQTVKKIEANLTELGKTSQSQNEKMTEANKNLSSSFSAIQGTMLNLGQAAQSIHNIFEIQQNKTRALENATDRLENAQLRLSEAYANLADAQLRLNGIEEAHSRDSLTLEQASINLEKAQKNLTKSIYENGKESLETRQAQLDLQNAQLDLADAQSLGSKKSQELAKAQKDLTDKQNAVTISNNNLERAQRQLDKTIGDAKWMYLDMGMSALSAAGNIGTFLNTVSRIGPITSATAAVGGEAGLTGAFTSLTGAIGIGGMAATLGAAGALVGLYLVLEQGDPYKANLKAVADIKKGYDDLKISVDLASQAILTLLQNEEIEKRAKVGKYSPYLSQTSQNFGQNVSSDLSQQFKNVGKPGLIPFSPTPPTPFNVSIGDGIIRPDGQVIQTDPRDTLVAMKDVDTSISNLGGGESLVINITGDNYGTDPDEIAQAIFKKVRRKITL